MSYIFCHFIYFFNWRIIALQNFVIFCQTSTRINHKYTHVTSLPNLPPISHSLILNISSSSSSFLPLSLLLFLFLPPHLLVWDFFKSLFTKRQLFFQTNTWCNSTFIWNETKFLAYLYFPLYHFISYLVLLSQFTYVIKLQYLVCSNLVLYFVYFVFFNLLTLFLRKFSLILQLLFHFSSLSSWLGSKSIQIFLI